MKIDIEPITPRTPQRFWCNKCDCRVVDSTDENTGRFFIVHGHVFQKKVGPVGDFDGDYHGVMFAHCWSCLDAAA